MRPRTKGRKRPYLEHMIRFGVAGWDYDDWWGPVYPADRKGKRAFDPLTYLSRFFDTIEINSTFYRPASAKSAASWARRVEHNLNFRFTAKLYQRFTHQRQEAWTRPEVAEVQRGLAPLLDAGRLGCLLVQFPWSFKRDAASREWLGDLVTAFGDFPLAVEVRHSSWNVPEFYASLRERGVGAVNIDQPVFRHSITPGAEVTSGVGYVRLHGRNYENWFRDDAESHERYDYLYAKGELEGWLERIHEVAKRARDTYVITNNHYRGQAPANALMLRRLAGETVDVPPELIAAFRDSFRGVGLG
jgi:uncharacterized protein YecE (DUF72 family)